MKFEDLTQPVITNKAPKNTTPNMASHGDALRSDINNTSLKQENEEGKEGEKSEDTSAGKENKNGKKGEDKGQKKQQQKERPLPETPTKNQTQPDNATSQRPLPERPTKNLTQQDNATPLGPLPETLTKNQHKPVNQTPLIHLPKGRNPLSGNPLPRISANNQEKKENQLKLNQDLATTTKTNGAKKRKLTNSNSTQMHTVDKKITVESRVSFIVLGLKGIIMVAANFLISSSEDISKAKPCDVEKALKSISLNYTVSCTYDDIKEVSKTLHDLGISLLAVNFLFFTLTLFFLLLPRICKLVVCILLPLVAIFSVFLIMEHNDILNSKTAEKDMNYVQIQSAMATWLEAHYTSDNISSSDAISNSWNKFFIEYDCCAIHQVQGTTNDFDRTPWCTTSGSCQTTSSQVPKTCCNGVSEDDYGSAPSNCHSSVNSGTFRSNCMNVIKQLSAVNVDECQLSRLQMSSIIIAILEVVATVLEVIAVIIWIVLWASNKRETEKDKIVRAFTKPKSKKEDNENKKNKKRREAENKHKNKKLCDPLDTSM